MNPSENKDFISRMMWFFLDNALITILALLAIIFLGLLFLPFDLPEIDRHIERSPVPVDAIPDIGENQQIVFTEWPGRSPQDMEDQITYPMAVSLQGIPGVKTIRSYSMFGFSSIYIIFQEGIDFYWSRSRVIERLSVISKSLPEGATPSLGPDATALGQIFWYTLEGKGFSLEELRTVQDWYVRYSLQSAIGVSEVASVGGYVREYQIDVNSSAMWEYKISLHDVFQSVRKANVDVGARTIEVNGVEYVIRGIGFIKTVQDVENIVVKEVDNTPIYLKQIAKITLGPALRRGALDKEGAEVVGGVVVVRYGENPLKVIQNVKEKIKRIAPGLAKKTLPDGTISQVKIVPFYDRTELIYETLDTLKDALIDETLITVVVILFFLMHFRSSMVVSLSLPIGVLIAFILMKIFKVDSNIMSLSGIAIAIGTMVDMGIIMTENIVKHLDEAPPDANPLHVVYTASAEVGSAVLTAISTTIVPFLLIFFMEGPEGKLFKPLAFTKTFALLGSVMVALIFNPLFSYLLFTSRKKESLKIVTYTQWTLRVLMTLIGFQIHFWMGIVLFIYLLYHFAEGYFTAEQKKKGEYVLSLATIISVVAILAFRVSPLGFHTSFWKNFFIVGFFIGLIAAFFKLFEKYYSSILLFLLNHKKTFMLLPASIVLWGLLVWQGFDTLFGSSASFVGLESARKTGIWMKLDRAFPGLGKEFMPDLDEGSYLFMPTTMPHASFGEALDILQKQDTAIRKIPEIEVVVGKIGRVESPLDPAPLSMIETVIFYKPEYREEKGVWKRQWRPHILSKDDIWKEILKVTEIPGSTSAPKLQPIAARIVMLQTGMRAPMGIKVKGKNLKEIEEVGLQIEKYLKEVTSVQASAVNADRIIGKPYLEFVIDREKSGRYGVNVQDVQDIIEIAIGGKKITTTVEGRERYPVRVRYQRELRDSIEAMKKILVPTRRGTQIPLSQIASLRYVRGPQMIKSEDTFLVGYVLFDKMPGYAEVEVVEAAQKYLQQKIAAGEFKIPDGTSYEFSGTYENQVRAEKRMMILIPACFLIIFLLIYLQFHSVSLTLMAFISMPVCLSGGFILIWLYGQSWFMDFSFFGIQVREMFHMRQYNLSVAVWVGFIALFGVATDDGVVMGTYLNQSFARLKPRSMEEIREAVLMAGNRRVRPCLMTTVTTLLALVPVLLSTGKGSDVLIPMALPSVGGMAIELITLFIVPVCYCGWREMLLTEGFQEEGEKE